MPQRQEYLTKEGLSKIEAELKRLREVERPEVADRIQRSKELGGTPNNAEYDAAKAEQAIIEGRIIELEAILTNAS
ncbi:MAG: transcription elongation factor GreA, partial [Chloroflexi bacterium]|nr:transcription elongation factor GreA [Chloroflexota bacterium]